MAATNEIDVASIAAIQDVVIEAALQQIDTSRHGLDDSTPAGMRRFDSFSKQVFKMMNHPKMSTVLQITDDERKAYGSTAFGDACLIARNMVAANAGAKFVMVTQPGWDHHSNIYGTNGQGGLYKTCSTLDAAYAALLADLRRLNLLDKTLVICMGEFGRTPGDLTPVAGQITPSDLAPHHLQPGERLLFQTTNSTVSWAKDHFDPDFISIRQDAARYLVDHGIRTVGVDYLSIGGYGKDVVETHQIMLGAEIWVIEGLNLSHVTPGPYHLTCLPLLIPGADGAPCRALLSPL
jgi:hypothetical protein